MNTKHCPKCMTVKPATDFQPNKAQKSGLQTYCRDCTRAYRNTAASKAAAKQSQAEWYARNSEAVLAKLAEKYRQNPEPHRAKQAERYKDPEYRAKCLLSISNRSKEIKAEIFGHYGNSCACCGETEPGFLTIDHINGCGKETRKEHGLGSVFYRWLKKNGFPEGFQTLCYNCNLGRERNGGICPHKLQSAQTDVAESVEVDL